MKEAQEQVIEVLDVKYEVYYSKFLSLSNTLRFSRID